MYIVWIKAPKFDAEWGAAAVDQDHKFADLGAFMVHGDHSLPVYLLFHVNQEGCFNKCTILQDSIFQL